jgi:hypothetical protein
MSNAVRICFFFAEQIAVILPGSLENEAAHLVPCLFAKTLQGTLAQGWECVGGDILGTNSSVFSCSSPTLANSLLAAAAFPTARYKRASR